MARAPMICPRCRHLIGAGDLRCPRCDHPRPAPLALWRTWLRRPGLGELVVQGILAANVLFYLLSLLLSRHLGAFFSPSSGALLALGATGALPMHLPGRLWSLIAASYLHSGLLHIFFNMMALRQIGPWVASEFGTSRMFAIYTLSGVGGFWLSNLAGVPMTIGASASICGLIGALLYFGKSRGGSYGVAVSREVSGWLISLALFGFLVPGINNWGHGGGVVSGMLLGRLLGYEERGAERGWHRLLGLLCLLLTLMVLGFALQSAFFGRG